MEGIERLETEVLEMNDANVSAIFEYLKRKTELHEKFNNEEKSIKQMYQFICDKAEKLKKNNVSMILSNVVFIWAVTYFNKTNEELGLKEKKVMPPTADEVIKKNEEKSKKEETKKTTEKNENQISMFEEVQE